MTPRPPAMPPLPGKRLPKSEWHWRCRWFSHSYSQESGDYARFTLTCTRCGFDPRTPDGRLGGVYTGASAPSRPNPGDMWFRPANTTTGWETAIWDGSRWSLPRPVTWKAEETT